MIQLQPADILLWRVDPKASFWDRLIGWGESKIGELTPQGYQYYHVGFVAANPKNYYQAKPPKLDKFILPDPFDFNIEVYRLKTPPTVEGLARIFAYAESRRGTWYDFLGVATFGFIELGGLEFCSQYTEDSFAHDGILLCPDIRFATPDDIAASESLVRVS